MIMRIELLLSLLLLAALVQRDIHSASVNEEDDNEDGNENENDSGGQDESEAENGEDDQDQNEGHSLEGCLRETADFVSEVEIDEQVRELVDQVRQYQNQEAPSEFVIAAPPEGCNAIRERVEISRTEVACNQEHQTEEPLILDNSKEVIRSNHAARDVLEAYLACQVADGAAGLIDQYNSIMSQSEGDEDGQVVEHVAEENGDEEEENGQDESDGDNNEENHDEEAQDDGDDQGDNDHEDNNDQDEGQEEHNEDENYQDEGEVHDESDHDEGGDDEGGDDEGDNEENDDHDQGGEHDHDEQQENDEQHHDDGEHNHDD